MVLRLLAPYPEALGLRADGLGAGEQRRDVGDRAERLADRALRQVHDLRDRMPGRRGHAAVSGPEIRRPAGRALPRRRRASADPSLDYCSGCGMCTQVCPQGVHIAEINTHARAELKADRHPAARPRCIARPDGARATGHAGGAAGQLTLRRPLRAPSRRCSAWTATRRCRVRRTQLPALGRKHSSPAPRGAWPTSTAAGRTATSPTSARGRRAAQAQRLPGRRPARQGCCGLPLQSNGLFDDARRYVAALAKRLAPRARGGRRSWAHRRAAR